MKKTITYTAIILSVVLMAVGFRAENILKVEASRGEWEKQLTRLETIRAVVDKSHLDHQEAKYVFNTIDSLELLIVPQLQKQITDTTKKK